MSEPFLGEIKLVSFNFPPKGWAFCNGQLLPINQNQALFSIMGTTYGGDGRTTFALPNLQGRVPIHAGAGFLIGNAGGEAAHTLTIGEMPAHVHPPAAQTTPTTPGTSPAGALWSTATTPGYGTAPNSTMNPATVASVGGGQPHENQPPYLVLNYVVALQGIFPSQN
jgi:microcystin-dependent protein